MTDHMTLGMISVGAFLVSFVVGFVITLLYLEYGTKNLRRAKK